MFAGCLPPAGASSLQAVSCYLHCMASASSWDTGETFLLTMPVCLFFLLSYHFTAKAGKAACLKKIKNLIMVLLKCHLFQNAFPLVKSSSFPDYLCEKILWITKISAFLQAFEQVNSIFMTTLSLREPAENHQQTFD